MGLFNFLQNKFSHGPAIVGTANTLAKQYLLLKQHNLEANNKAIYFKIIEQRYHLLPIDSQKQKVLEAGISDSLKFRDFVLFVLTAETDLLDTENTFFDKIVKVIEDELVKYNNLPR